MITFLQYLERMQTEPYFNRLYLKLNRSQQNMLASLAAEIAPLELHARERAINRLFLDNLTPPKNHRIMIELLANANSKCYFEAERAKT